MSTEPGTTPRALGYHMPAEWTPHEATWLAWPHNAEDWPRKFQPIPWVYGEIVRRLAEVEIVHLLVNDAASERRVRSLLARTDTRIEQVRFHQWPTNRVWTRDSGPIFVRRAADSDGASSEPPLGITDWQFNAWAKYGDWELDDQFPARVADLLQLPSWQPVFQISPGKPPVRVVLEGGSIDVNGAGTLVTTEECLLSQTQQRNPGMIREDLEKVFHDYLGIDRVIWLNRGIAGDDTHGHVDDIARFIDPGTLVAAVEHNRADENHLPLAENLDRLRAARNQAGKAYRVVELPLPDPVVFDGQRLPASYANFYIANEQVLVPTFNDSRDREALNILAGLFPGRRIVGIHSVDLIWGLGAIHCLTQQQPRI